MSVATPARKRAEQNVVAARDAAFVVIVNAASQRGRLSADSLI
jgi:hypothetical protein